MAFDLINRFYFQQQNYDVNELFSFIHFRNPFNNWLWLFANFEIQSPLFNNYDTDLSYQWICYHRIAVIQTSESQHLALVSHSIALLKSYHCIEEFQVTFDKLSSSVDLFYQLQPRNVNQILMPWKHFITLITCSYNCWSLFSYRKIKIIWKLALASCLNSLRDCPKIKLINQSCWKCIIWQMIICYYQISLLNLIVEVL